MGDYQPPPEVALDLAHAHVAAAGPIGAGPIALDVASGTMVPVVAFDRTVGVAFVGAATAHVSLSQAEARALADRQVMWSGAPVASGRAIVDAGKVDTPVTTALWFADDASLAAMLGGPEVALDGATAKSLLSTVQTRGDLLAHRSDLVTAMATRAPGFSDLELLTGTRWGTMRPAASPPNDDDRWLSACRDAKDAPWRLFVAARDGEGRSVAATAPRWFGEGGGPFDALDLAVKVLATPYNARSGVAVDVTADFHLRARSELSSLALLVPRRDDQKGAWKVASITVDGHAVPVPAWLDLGAPIPLPSPIAAGAEAHVVVRWSDAWTLQVPADGAGRSTGLVDFLPRLGDDPGRDWPFVVDVGLPADAKLESASAGLTSKEWTDGGTAWVESATDRTPAPPWVAIGDWASRSEPGVEGLPAVRVHLFQDEKPELPSFPPMIRTIVAYDQQLLPAFPEGELEVFQAPDAEGGFTWEAVPGLVALQQMQTIGAEDATRAEEPHLEAWVLAHEIAHQYWGGLVREARPEDRWLVESLAQVYACRFVAAAYGAKDCEAREATWKRVVETADPVGYSLPGAPYGGNWDRSVYDYGAYVLGKMLRARLGDQAFFGGLDALARGRSSRPATTEDLEAAFEKASGKDLHDFFAYWVTAGLIPSIAAKVTGKDVTVTADVPFGTFDVPLRVTSADGATSDVWVSIVDGVGKATLAAAPKKVLLDPDGLVLARKRRLDVAP